jgi:predicted NUDIX family phosphoesterase
MEIPQIRIKHEMFHESPEKVLCIRRSHLPRKWVADSAVVKMTAETFFGMLAGAPVHWLPRAEAESDPAYKQLIPYVLLQSADGLHTGCYRRNGSEGRLHSFWSVGIGGHINPGDCGNGDGSLSAVVRNGLDREMREEFRSLPRDATPVFHGVINEEQTPVGRVHLGLVHRMQVWSVEGLNPGEELDSFMWAETERVFRKPLELWSKLALNLLETEWE